jgi:acetyl esterase
MKKSINSLHAAIAPCLIVLMFLTFTAKTKGQSQVRDYASDEHLSPAVRTFLKTLKNGSPRLETLTPVQAREALVKVQKAYKVDLSGISVIGKTFKMTAIRSS